MKSIRHAVHGTIVAALLACVACGGPAVVASPPPPPAYGYYYHRPDDQVVLVYDPVLSVYAVSRYPDTYFYDGRYYRLSGNTWYRTTSISGPWATVSYQSIPPGLHNKYRSPGHSYVRYKHSKVQQPGHGHHEQ